MDEAGKAATAEDDALPGAAMPLLAAGKGAFHLLNGVRVLDLATSIAGPYAGTLLSDFGADVVTVERPGAGDGARLVAMARACTLRPEPIRWDGAQNPEPPHGRLV